MRLLIPVLSGLLLLACAKRGDRHIPDEDPGAVAVPTWDGPPPVRGYVSRPCGFDLDHDGVVGEAGECVICDGATTDPDGDGTDEDIIYVDCDSGTDADGCGAVDGPCATIGFAWNSIADGPDDGAEDILCFRGTCLDEDDVSPGVSGIAGHHVEPRSGSAGRDFELPRDPTMLVGWDADGDHEYPPHDTDDVAVLDGGSNALERPFTGLTSYIEMAHFTVLDYGRYNDSDHGGFVELKRGGATSTHIHFHDLVLQSINMDRDHVSSRITFDCFGGTQINHVMIRNIDVTDNGGYFVRGSAPWATGEDGPLRWQNVSLTAHGCDYSGPGVCEDANLANHTGWKVWGWVTGIEILDSVFDANTDAWEPKSVGGPPTNLIVANLCSRDWLVRNNLIINYKQAIGVDGYEAGYCDNETARTVDDVVFDANIYFNDFEWGWGHHAVIIGEGGNSPGETIEDVTISNNFFYTANRIETWFFLAGGNSHGTNPGTVAIVGNTCVGTSRRFGALAIGNPDSGNFRYPHQHYIIRNNVFTGLDPGQTNVNATYVPEILDMDGNVYDPDGGFQWEEASLDSLEQWQATAGTDTGSATCEPDLVDVSSGDLHLMDADSCARDAGTDVSAIVSTDIDGQPRPAGGGWDSGADEVD